MKTIRYETDADQVVTLTFDDPDASVNTMSPQWKRDMFEAIDRLVAEKDAIAGVIIASAKPVFLAGADLKVVQRHQREDMPRVFAETEALKKQFRKLETLGKPVVACIAGTALGGGLEITLCAHHRIAVDDPKTQLGLPEVTLGLLPAAGGVTKLVRMLGLLEALPHLLDGRNLTPAEAAKVGIVGELVATADDLRPAALAWIKAHPAALQPWDRKGYEIPNGGVRSPKVVAAMSGLPATYEQKTRGLTPAISAIMACASQGARVDFETALRLETRAIVKLFVDPVSKNLISLFFDRARIRAGASRPQGVAPWKATKVGVLGAGMMGAGIAYATTMRGVDCVLKDVNLEAAEAGKAYTRRLTDKRVEKGLMTAADQARVLDRIQAADRVEDLAGCDLVIEAVFENRELKAQVTREIEPLMAQGGVFASNTSTLPITGLATASARPEKYVGLHFFSPVDKMELVEIVVGERTDDETLARAYDFVRQIGKTPIVVGDGRRFYTSRTFGSFINEGIGMLAEGVPAEVIENAALSVGMPVGPLAVIDETSLTTVQAIRDQNIADAAAEGRPYEKEAGDLVVEDMVRKHGRGGRKAGGGFYDYPSEGGKRLWPGLKTHYGKADATWNYGDLRDRLLYRQALETLRCLDEGVLRSTHDANVGSVAGIGFPPHTGGTWRFIEAQGLDRFLARCRELAAAYGDRFNPPELSAEWRPGQADIAA